MGFSMIETRQAEAKARRRATKPPLEQRPTPGSGGRGGQARLFSAKETYISLLAAGGILLHLIFQYGLHTATSLSMPPLYVILALGGVPLVVDLARKAIRLEFGSDLLAGASILTSVALGEYLVGSIAVLMLSGGTALEQYATRRASSVLQSLARRMPRVAHRKDEKGVSDINIEDIAIGNSLVVFPHEVCPVDGVVA